MVNPALLASIDALDADELDELIEYAATKRIGTIVVTDEQRAILESRRNDPGPRNRLTDDEFDARHDSMTSRPPMAAPKHRTHAGALADLADAVNYMKREAPEQAPRLSALYREVRANIRRHPPAHAALYDDYRRAVLVPFKYMIVFVTDGRSVDILAVLHAQRDPETLKTELQERTFE